MKVTCYNGVGYRVNFKTALLLGDIPVRHIVHETLTRRDDNNVSVNIICDFCYQFLSFPRANIRYLRSLSSLFLNELRDGASTTSDDRLFHILTILQLKNFSQVVMTLGVCQFERISSDGNVLIGMFQVLKNSLFTVNILKGGPKPPGQNPPRSETPLFVSGRTEPS